MEPPKDLIRKENTPQLPEGQLVWIPPGFALTTEKDEPPPQESHLWDYIWMIWNRRWLVVLILLLCVSLAALKNYRSIPVYKAYAKLRIAPEEPKLISFEGEKVSVGSNRSPDFINTQLQVLQGRQLAQKVIDKLNLFPMPRAAAGSTTGTVQKEAPQPEPTGIALIWRKALTLAGFAPENTTARPENVLSDKEKFQIAQQMRISAFLVSLKAKPMESTEIIQVEYTWGNPRECALIVNTLCDEYITWTYESKFESFNHAREWLKEKLDAKQVELEKSETELIQLTGGKDIIGAQDGQVPQQIESYRQQIVEAEKVMFQKEFDLQRFNEGKNFSALRFLNDAQLNQLLDKYAEDEIELDKKKAGNFGEKSPELMTIKAEMSRIGIQLQDALALARKKAQFEFDQAKANHEYLKKMYDAEKERVTGIQKNLIKFNLLKRQVETDRQLFDSLVQRLKEVDITSGIKAGYASVIEPALPPVAANASEKQRTLLIGVMMGLFLGIGLIFFLDYMDTSVKDPDELERQIHLPILGCVFHCAVKRMKGEGRVNVEQMTHFRPRSEFAENIRSLRTSIQYSRTGRPPKTILVTSCLPGEGKTTIATNLAIALASRDKKVLLIDADLKKPSLNKLFSTDLMLGLSEVLTGKFDGCNLPETEIRNLFVMPAGARVSNPVDLLDSEAMQKLLERSSDEYDYIILDSAPVLNMADATVLSPCVDGLIVVVQPGRTPRDAVRRVKDRLVDVQGNILGLVMNNPTKSAGKRYGNKYGYGYHRRYAYRYGYAHDGHGGGLHGENGNGFTPKVRDVVDVLVASREIPPVPDARQDRDDT